MTREESWNAFIDELRAYVQEHHHFPNKHIRLLSRVKYTRKKINDGTLEDYHGNLEIRDLMEFNEKYTDDYIKELFEKILKDGKGVLSVGDVYRILFGTEINEDVFLDRPLSKMKYDLLKNMGVI